MTCRDQLQAFAEDGFSKHCRCGRTVACNVAGFACSFLDELGAHVFKGILQFDVFSNRYAVLGHAGAAPTFVQNGIATARPEGHTNGSGEFAGPVQQFLSRVIAVNQLFRTHAVTPSNELKRSRGPDQKT